MTSKALATKQTLDALSAEEKGLFKKALEGLREEMEDNVYIAEALKVLAAGGLRSAIGSYWNAVVDDLRNKVMHRSLDLFNKELKPKREIKLYEDFQDVITDADLIDGAYKIGVITWEARKLLHHARETRNIFDGHPKSTDPSVLKVLDMMNDCNKYVLSQEYPPAIIHLDKYVTLLDSPGFDRNLVAIEQAVGDLPEIYKDELINRLYSAYTHAAASVTLKSNIEVVGPVLWQVLSKATRIQVAKRFDKDVVSGDAAVMQSGTDFLAKVGGLKYASTASRRAIIEPVLKELEEHLDDWAVEGKAVAKLERLGTNIPGDLIMRYVSALSLTYVGYKGGSAFYSRTDFYSNAAAPVIAKLFELFDDEAARAFVEVVRTNRTLRSRVSASGQLNRLRNLGNILLERPKLPADVSKFLSVLVDEQEPGKFFKRIGG
jgi:hypothetical protein